MERVESWIARVKVLATCKQCFAPRREAMITGVEALTRGDQSPTRANAASTPGIKASWRAIESFTRSIHAFMRPIHVFTGSIHAFMRPIETSTRSIKNVVLSGAGSLLAAELVNGRMHDVAAAAGRLRADLAGAMGSNRRVLAPIRGALARGRAAGRLDLQSAA